MECDFKREIRHSEATLYQNEMIFFGGYNRKTLNDIVRINLDDFSSKVINTGMKHSFWHSTNIWNDKLLIFGGEYISVLYQYDLKTNKVETFEIVKDFETYDNLSHFIHQDTLYLTSINSLYKYDLINNVGFKIEHDLTKIIKRGSTMFLYDNFIYYFGGTSDDDIIGCVNDFYRINFDSFEVEKLDYYNLPISYGHSGFLYNDSFVIYGIYDSKKSYENVVRITLPKKLYSKGFLKVFEKLEKDTRFIFE